MSPHSGQFPLIGRPSWWREPEVALLVLLVVAAYFIRLGDVSMRGEEPRRAQVAFEILQSGDWIVPREQGAPFLSRPPLQNWLIAFSTELFDSRAAWVVRLPSALAMLLTTLLIYGYARTGLSRTGALAGAAAFATFAEMFTTGAQAETEMVFIALVSGSLILWHWGQMSGWPPVLAWVAGYGCMALAVLCKGPQPPVYFVGAVGIYLLLTGRLRSLFTWSHLAGILVGTAIVLAWLIPCARQESLPVVKGIVFSDTGMRFREWEALKVVKHLLQYPLEILGCTLPWSPLLLAYANRRFRQSLGAARPLALFTGICVLVAFPTCWIPPDAQTRYFAPLYPCLAVLVGVVADRCARPDLYGWSRTLWQHWSIAIAGTMFLTAIAVPLGSIVLKGHERLAPWAEQPLFAIVFAVAGIVLARMTYAARRGGNRQQVRLGVLALAAFMVLTCTGVATNIRIRRSEDQAGAMAHLMDKLPPGHRLISFGHIDSLFAYYYARPIEAKPLMVTAADVPTDDDVYFCFDTYTGYRPTLPFEWQEVAAIPMDRYKWPPSKREVVVGKRLKVPQAKNLR